MVGKVLKEQKREFFLGSVLGHAQQRKWEQGKYSEDSDSSHRKGYWAAFNSHAETRSPLHPRHRNHRETHACSQV